MKAVLRLVPLLSIILRSAAGTAAPEALIDVPGVVGRDPFTLPSTPRQDDLPQGPLRRHSLAELKLVATVHGIDPPRALIEDPEGLGFVVVVGSVIGAEGGKLTGIEPGRVVIEAPASGAAPVVLLVNREDIPSSDSR